MLQRERVASVTGRKSLFGNTGTRGKVAKALNKLNGANFVVVSHSIFRLLVDDEGVSQESVFGQIMEYAFVCHQNSELYARVCADLANFYPDLRSHIRVCLRETHAGLTALRTQAGASYQTYLASIEQRRKACGCFLFVAYLCLHRVVGAELLLDEIHGMFDTVDATVQAVLDPPSPAEAGGGGGGATATNPCAVLEAYIDCLGTVLGAKNIRSMLRQTRGWGEARQRMVAILAPFAPGKARDKRFKGKAWFGLMGLRQHVA